MIDFSQYKAAVFDLDGVITDTAPLHFQAWKILADDLGIPFNEKDNLALKGVDRMASLDFILSLGAKGYSAEQKQKMAKAKNDYYLQLLDDVTESDILVGVLSLFEFLKSHSIKIALASASRNAPMILQKLGLTHQFDHVANPAYARSKPAPDIFLYAAYGVQTHPTECIAFEDALAGIQAIKSSGMFAVSVGDSSLATSSDVHVHQLDELLR